MKHFLFAVVLSTAPFCSEGQFWAVGCLDSITQLSTPTVSQVAYSTGPLSNIVSNVVLCSSTTAPVPDCYKLLISPNGTISSKWVPKPQ